MREPRIEDAAAPSELVPYGEGGAMSRDSLVEKYNERHEGVDYFYTTCHNNGCWDAT